MGEVDRELGGSFVEHVGPWSRFEILVAKAVDPARFSFLVTIALPVDEVEGPVGSGGGIDRLKVGIGGADEFRAGIKVAHFRTSHCVVINACPSRDPGCGIGEYEVVLEIGRQSVAAKNGLSACGGERIGERKLLKAIFEGPVRKPVGVGVWEEPVDGAGLGITENDLAVIVLSEPPLPAVGEGVFFDDLAICESKTEVIAGGVDVIVDGPN